MEASTKVCLYKIRIKRNGKFPVKIRVIWQRKFYFYQSGIDLTEEEFKVYHSSKNLKKQFEDITYYLKKANEIVKDLGQNFSWKEFDALYYNRKSSTQQKYHSQSINVISKIEDYARKLFDEGFLKSSKSYTTTANHLKYYLKKKGGSLLFSDLTPEFLNSFEKHLLSKEKPLSYSSVGVYMRNIRAIFNQGIATKIIEPDLYPFGKGKYVPPATKKAKKSLSINDIEKLYYYQSDDTSEDWAKDMWLFAYFANGINVKDIAFLKYENINGEILSFFRSKTKNSTKENMIEIEVPINDDLKHIIEKWGNKSTKPQNFIFDILHPKDLSDLQIFRDVNQAVKTINLYMKRIAASLNLERSPTTNFARHSFSTILKRSGVPIEMISEQLGHTSIKTTQIYLGSFESAQKREISKYLTSFKHKK
ncbi:MAG: site-specific integrase [Ginsengibacter sp.]